MWATVWGSLSTWLVKPAVTAVAGLFLKLGISIWKKDQQDMGKLQQQREQEEAVDEAQERMDGVKPVGRRGLIERLRKRGL